MECISVFPKKMAFTLSLLPTKGLAFTKQALNKSLEQNLDQQLETEDSFQRMPLSNPPPPKNFLIRLPAFSSFEEVTQRGFLHHNQAYVPIHL